MIASLLFLLLGSLVGLVILRQTKTRMYIEEQLLWSISLGIILLTTWTFLLAVVIKQQDIALIVACITAGILVLDYFNRYANRVSIATIILQRKRSMTRRETIAWLAVLLPWLIYSIFTIPRLLWYENGDLLAGWTNVWADWAVHLRNSTFFANRDVLSLDNPLFAGTAWHYPYLSSYLSATLQRLNLDLASSLTWPTFALFATLPGLLFSLGKRVTQNSTAGVIFTYVVLLSGGMGVYYLLKDILAGHYFWEASQYSPLLYTDMRQAGVSTNSGIWFMNIMISELFPQRAFLAGLPLALFVLLTTWESVSTEKVGRAQLILAGVLFGILPLIHTHSFIALGIITPTFFSIHLLIAWHKSGRKLSPLVKKLFATGFALLYPATLIGFTLLFVFVFDASTSNSFIHPIHWWVPQQELPVNPVLWWGRNAGPLIILALLGFIRDRRYLSLGIAGLVIFLIANFLSFQPWHYDNLKLLTYWYILWSLPVTALIVKLPRKVILVSIVAVGLMTGAGAADTLSIATSSRSDGLILASKDELQFAEMVRRELLTRPNALVVAATDHNHPVALASGSRLYLGFEGWIWSYGIDYSNRLNEIGVMYRFTDEGQQLLKDRGIDYMVLSPREEKKFQAATIELTSYFPAVVDFGGYKLLEIR